MPKTSRDRSASFDRSRMSPYSPVHCSSSSCCESNHTKPPATVEDLKEWEDARCPICLEHPHNAVLLICSSLGCRPYLCDRSDRLSSCFSQFRKSLIAEALVEGSLPPVESSSEVVAVEAVVANEQDEEKSHGSIAEEPLYGIRELQQKLVCPFCRGQISGWVVPDLARDFMNSKTRSCACETCEFTGTYSDLTKHALSEHPHLRPSKHLESDDARVHYMMSEMLRMRYNEMLRAEQARR